MRRALAVATVFAFVVAVAMTAVAGSYGTYRDEFKQPGYSGSVGTLDWSKYPWTEIKDDGSPGSGAVHVDSEGDCVGSSCLHIWSEGSELNGVGAGRHADTSMFSSFDICYEVTFLGDDELTDAVLVVEKSVDGGGVWYQLAAYDLYSGFWLHPSHAIGEYDSTTIRFVVTGTMDGEVFIDDVEIKGAIKASTSTTSTTMSETTSSSVLGTTTSTRPTTTTTKVTATTTPRPEETTTTTHVTSATNPDRLGASTTTTTISDSTTTTEASGFVVGAAPPGGTLGPLEGGGIREQATGMQADFDDGLFGHVEGGSLSISGVDHHVDYRMAVEEIKASWVWLVVLALVVAWSIVSGLERRRSVPAT